MHYPHHSTSLETLLLFLLGFFLRCHRHLLIGFPGRVCAREKQSVTSGEEIFLLKTLPHFVGGKIITIQRIVCQEKNAILKKYFYF